MAWRNTWQSDRNCEEKMIFIFSRFILYRVSDLKMFLDKHFNKYIYFSIGGLDYSSALDIWYLNLIRNRVSLVFEHVKVKFHVFLCKHLCTYVIRINFLSKHPLQNLKLKEVHQKYILSTIKWQKTITDGLLK